MKGVGHKVTMCTTRPHTSIKAMAALHVKDSRSARSRPAQCSMKHSAHRICAGVAEAASEKASPSSTDWFQKTVILPAKKRGCHVITRQLLSELPEIQDFDVGLANFFILHTSGSLTINENASPDVPLDLNDALDKIVPEGHHYRHLDEGMDDMPAHVKSSLMGASLTIPISRGRLALGTWQGVYLNEHRNYGGSRQVVVTIQGQKRKDGRKYSTGF